MAEKDLLVKTQESGTVCLGRRCLEKGKK